MIDVKETRKKANMNQRELAAHLGVHIGTVKSWENGRSSPQPKHVAALKAMTAADIVTAESDNALAFTRQVRAFCEIGYKIDCTYCDASVWRAVMVK